MKGECLSYHMSTKLKPNDYPLTNNSHFYDTTPPPPKKKKKKMHIRTKKYVFFYCFFNWHLLNDKFPLEKIANQ